MGNVAKYNICKSISTFCTVGSPIITLACCSDLFVHKTGTSLSAAGIFAVLLTILFAKDKIAENIKMPSAFVLALVIYIAILIVEKILTPVKTVCIVTMITSGIDELTFKRFYKNLESLLPESANLYKHFGFIFTTSSKIGGK